MMAKEPEPSDYANMDYLQKAEKNSVKTEPSERRLLKIVVVTLAVLCVLQAILNITLRLALYSKEASLKLSIPADLCEIPEPEQFLTRECSCCTKQLRRIVREYKTLEEQRQFLQKMVNILTGHMCEDTTHSGSGSLEYFDLVD